MQARAERRRFRDRVQPLMSISVAAFIMSLGATATNLYYSLRGSEMAVRAPRQILLYKDGTDAGAVLTLAARTDAINLADGYGDVLVDAEAELSSFATRHPFQGMLTTVFADHRDDKGGCASEARCLVLNGLTVVERTDQLIDFPAGAAKPIALSYPVTAANCEASAPACRRFADFDAAANALGGKPLDVSINLHFQSDGEKRVRCRTGRVDAAYLKAIGWITLDCAKSA